MYHLAQRLWLLGFFLLHKQLIRCPPHPLPSRPQKLLLVTSYPAFIDWVNSLPSTTHSCFTKESRNHDFEELGQVENGRRVALFSLDSQNSMRTSPAIKDSLHSLANDKT